VVRVRVRGRVRVRFRVRVRVRAQNVVFHVSYWFSISYSSLVIKIPSFLLVLYFVFLIG
jgi:hypothetical protein